jgi:tetratricopeptide (TPR) repeat protein
MYISIPILGDMRLLYSLAIVTMISIQCFSQRSVDSLVQVVKTLPDDTLKVRVYGWISNGYSKMRTKNDLARAYADSVLLVSQRIKFEAGIASAHYHYGNIEQFEGNLKLAIDHFNQALAYHEREQNTYQMVNNLFALGKAYRNLGEFDKSLDQLYRAAMLCEKSNDKDGLSQALNSMGGIYRQLKRYPEAIAQYRRSNALYKELGRDVDYAMGLQNVGNVYSGMGSYDTAKVLYQEALKIVHDLGKAYEEAIVLGNLGTLHNKLNEHDVALSYHLRAIPIKRNLPNKRSLAVALKDAAYSYMKLTQFNKAAPLAAEALALAEKVQAKDLLLEAYQVKADIASGIGEYKQALEFHKMAMQWKDSIFNEQNAQQINELTARYESEKKDRQIEILAKEKEFQAKDAERRSMLNNVIIGGLILILICAGLFAYVFWQKLKTRKLLENKDNELKEVNYRQQMSELEMKALRAQINPHFLFNCMNSINRMILDGANEQASIYLAKFSKLMRLILENAETSTVSLQNELTLLESYIQLESLRFKRKIEYKITVDENIDRDATYLPSMVLQPFVENAIWHGLLHKNSPEQGIIEITVKEENNRLYCAIQDNGIGREKAREFAEQSILKSRSLGVKITEDRLRLLSKDGWEKLVNIIDLKDSWNGALGTRVEIFIPIE